jgi:hypothetical protein
MGIFEHTAKPPTALQESVVQGLLSSQESGAYKHEAFALLQILGLQGSDVGHNPGAQVQSLGVFLHPVVVLQVSIVHVSLSSHVFGEYRQPCIGSQLENRQGLPVSQFTAVKVQFPVVVSHCLVLHSP